MPRWLGRRARRERLEAAIERLIDAERFAEAEQIVSKAAPQLQKVLAAALADGGWFGEPHEAETLRAATVPDPDERIAAVRALLAEEARMGMMVGVAVGWALNEELRHDVERDEPRDSERGRTEMEIKFHGQSCFEFSEGGTTVLIDPFLKPNNPVAVATAEEVEPTVSRSATATPTTSPTPSRSRSGPAPSASRSSSSRNGSAIRASRTVSDPNFGGTVRFDWGWICSSRLAHEHPARIPGTVQHRQPGRARLINIGGKTIYHAGDTCLFGDMKLIAQRQPVDLALLPIGGHYTMDRHDGAVAAQFVAASTVIPMHFNTFPLIETDADRLQGRGRGSTSATSSS